jgi:chemotaxis protein CheC
MMDTTHKTHVSHMQTLRPYLADAVVHASRAMCGWTAGRVSLELEDCRQVPLEAFHITAEISPDLLTMVVLGVQDYPNSCLLVAFDHHEGRKLAATLLKREFNPNANWSSMEESAVMETANILGSAYFNELSRLLGIRLLPSAPYLTHDYGASVLQQAIMTQAMTCEQVQICTTNFAFDSQQLKWQLYFLPGGDLLQAMTSQLAKGGNES